MYTLDSLPARSTLKRRLMNLGIGSVDFNNQQKFAQPQSIFKKKKIQKKENLEEKKYFSKALKKFVAFKTFKEDEVL